MDVHARPLRRIVIATALLVGFTFVAAAPAGADSVQVKSKSRKTVKLVVRADRGDRCVVTVKRGGRRASKTVRLGAGTRKVFKVQLRGKRRAKVRARVRCTAASAPTPPQPVALSPYDTIIVERISSTGVGRVNVYRGVGDRGLDEVYSASTELSGWDDIRLDVWGDYFEHAVHPFSADFSKVLFHGRRAGERANHVGLLDLVTGSATDLTAARQGSGFSAPVLCEENAGFVSQLAPVARNGSDLVSFIGRTGLPSGGPNCFGDEQEVSLANPTALIPVDPAAPPASTRVSASEDGRYQWKLLGDKRGFAAVDGSQSVPVDCVPSQGSTKPRDEFLLGWTGPRTVALAVSDFNHAGAADDWRLATLQPDGSVQCTGGIPATGREIKDLALSFDSQAILFSAEESSGFVKYRQPISGGEPVPAAYDDVPANEVGRQFAIYRVGPQ